MSKKILFYIDGSLLSEYGVHVESCTGLFTMLKQKERLSNDDSQTHGKFYDLGAVAKYEERQITLNCFVATTSRFDFFNKINGILNLFDTPGYHRLSAFVDGDFKLHYEVIRIDGDGIEPSWNSSRTLARFKIQLTEPIPVKRIISTTGGVTNISMHTEKLLTISWGDGTYDYDVTGAVNISKTLPADTEVIVIGDIDEITNFNLTGGVVKWDIWC